MRFGPNTEVLVRRTFYLKTYLIDRDGTPTLLGIDVALVRGPSGREIMRRETTAQTFADVDEMVGWITENQAVEAPPGADGNPRWLPSRKEMASGTRQVQTVEDARVVLEPDYMAAAMVMYPSEIRPNVGKVEMARRVVDAATKGRILVNPEGE